MIIAAKMEQEVSFFRKMSPVAILWHKRLKQYPIGDSVCSDRIRKKTVHCVRPQDISLVLYGRTYCVETDRELLSSVIGKPLTDLSPRIQRMRLKWQKHDLELTYIPRKYMHVGDDLWENMNM